MHEEPAKNCPQQMRLRGKHRSILTHLPSSAVFIKFIAIFSVFRTLHIDAHRIRLRATRLASKRGHANVIGPLFGAEGSGVGHAEAQDGRFSKPPLDTGGWTNALTSQEQRQLRQNVEDQQRKKVFPGGAKAFLSSHRYVSGHWVLQNITVNKVESIPTQLKLRTQTPTRRRFDAMKSHESGQFKGHEIAEQGPYDPWATGHGYDPHADLHAVLREEAANASISLSPRFMHKKNPKQKAVTKKTRIDVEELAAENAEFEKDALDNFAGLDLNEDGQLDRSEFRLLTSALRSPPGLKKSDSESTKVTLHYHVG